MATIASDSPLPRREVRRTKGTPKVASLAVVALISLLLVSVGLSVYTLLRPPVPDPMIQSELAAVRQTVAGLNEQIGTQRDALFAYAQDIEELRRRLDSLSSAASTAPSAPAAVPSSASGDPAQSSSTETGP
jgi:hypothetical protein